MPRLAIAFALARKVADDTDARTPSELARQLGIGVTYAPLGASRGGLEAILIPVRTRFRIVCDPWVDPTTAPIEAAWIRETRIAHELAHTLFYAWGDCEARRACVASPAEERFCDAFAGALVTVLRWPPKCHTAG